MATAKDEKPASAETGVVTDTPIVPATPVPVVTAPVPVAVIGPARVFRDKVYNSRTLIMPDGRTLPVSQGRVTAVGDDQFDYLKAHPDLEQLTE